MEKLYEKVFLHLSRPTFGNDVPRLVHEVAALAGVARLAPGSRASNLLRSCADLHADTPRVRTARLGGCA